MDHSGIFGASVYCVGTYVRIGDNQGFENDYRRNNRVVNRMDDYSSGIQVLICIGACFAYFTCLIFVTCLSVNILTDGFPDDIDYAMTADIIQFFIIVAVIIGRVLQI